MFRISFHPDWQIDSGFFDTDHGASLNPCTQLGTKNKDFGTQCFADRLNQSLASSVAQAGSDWHVNKPSFPGARLDHGVGEFFSPKRVRLF